MTESLTVLHLLIDFHKDAKRQGPGSLEATKRALDIIGFSNKENLKIADIGCGTGAQTIALAQNSCAEITAVDLFPEFLEKLDEKSKRLNLTGRIKTIACSMEELNFSEEEFDIIWSEGTIYIMGFENGIKQWKKYLKNEGYLAVSEICWKTNKRPEELDRYWNEAYPDINTPSCKIKQLENNGYSPVAFFMLPDNCWIDNYYKPILDRIDSFLDKHNHNIQAVELINNERKEIEMYEKYNEYFGYSFFIAKKR